MCSKRRRRNKMAECRSCFNSSTFRRWSCTRRSDRKRRKAAGFWWGCQSGVCVEQRVETQGQELEHKRTKWQSLSAHFGRVDNEDNGIFLIHPCNTLTSVPVFLRSYSLGCTWTSVSCFITSRHRFYSSSSDISHHFERILCVVQPLFA